MTAKYVEHSDSDAVLMQQFFIYLARVINEYDGHKMRRLRIRPDQSQRIGRMTTADLLLLGMLGGHCIDFTINERALDEVFEQLDRKKGHRDLIDRCIRMDASKAMMAYFFGMSGRVYTRSRQALNVPARAGRHPEPDEELAARIYRLYTERGRQFNAETLLHIAESLGTSLRIVWDEINDIQLNEERQRNSLQAVTPSVTQLRRSACR